MFRQTLLVSALLALVACSPAEETPTRAATAAASPALGSGVEQVYFDKNVAAGDDFYRYVNGTWLASTTIPADKSNYSAAHVLIDQADENLRTLIENASAADAAR